MAEYAQNYVFKFEGKSGDISADTLGIALISLSRLIKEANSELNPSQPIELNVHGHQTGSFLIHLGIDPSIAGLFPALTSPEGIVAWKAATVAVMEVIRKIVELKQSLGGKPPKETPKISGSTVTIQAGDGSTIQTDARTYNIFLYNEKIPEAVKDIFETVRDDRSITGLEMRKADAPKSAPPLFKVERDSFHALAAPVDTARFLPLDAVRTIRQRASLNILKPAFNPKYKWDVLLGGYRVSVNMGDQKFLEKIENRDVAFSKGDTLDVLLEIDQELVPGTDEFQNRQYNILEVYNHQKSMYRQQSIFS